MTTYTVKNGKVQRNVRLESGDVQHVLKGGLAMKTQIVGSYSLKYISGSLTWLSGIQYVSAGGSAYTTTLYGGVQHVAGVASGTVIQSSTFFAASQVISSGGKALKTTLNDGRQYVQAGGKALNTTIYGGFQYVSAGGSASATTLRGGSQGAGQNVYGVAYDTILKSGSQYIGSGGRASNTTIYGSGTYQMIAAGAIASNTKVSASGGQQVYSGGLAQGTQIDSGGWVTVFGGGNAKNVKVTVDGALSLYGGGSVTFLEKNVMSGTLQTLGVGNRANLLYLTKKSQLNYYIVNDSAKGKTVKLTVSKRNTQNLANCSVTVGKAQGIGVYELSKNIVQSKNTQYSIYMQDVSSAANTNNSEKLGIAKLNGTALTKNGVTYSLKTSGTQVNLTVAVKSGARPIFKGTAKADKLTGSTNSDIFYGGKGNDIITGKNGRDVVVYDKTAWGKDTIAKTNGTMTLLFKDITAKDIATSLSGSTMTITRKSDANQKIIIKGWGTTTYGWGETTHNIVYGSGMTNFNKYLKAVKPTTAQTTAARNEVFKKAGLAAA